MQGTVKQKVGSAFRLDDGTGTVLVALAGIPQAADQVADGCYTLVVGKVVSGAGQLHIKAHKVRRKQHGGSALAGRAAVAKPHKHCQRPDHRSPAPH